MSADPDDFEQIAAIQAAYRDRQEALLTAYRELAKAADAMSVHGATMRTTDGRLYRTEQGKAYDSARAAVQKLETP